MDVPSSQSGQDRRWCIGNFSITKSPRTPEARARTHFDCSCFHFFIRSSFRLGKGLRRCAQRPRRDKCPKMEERPLRFDYVLQHAARDRGSIARAQNSSRGCCLSSSVLTAHSARAARRLDDERAVVTRLRRRRIWAAREDPFNFTPRSRRCSGSRLVCKACKLQADPRMRGHTRRQAMLRAANRPGSARRRAQPRPTRQRPITCFPDFTFQKTIPRRCRLVASVLEYSANLRDPSPSRSINRSTRLEARED